VTSTARTLVLCYHGVSERWQSDLAVTPQRLEEQLRLLLRRGWQPATFHQAATAPPWRKTLAVTFDDGYRSVRELAFPVLQRLGIPATVYVPTALVGWPGPLSWDGIERWLGTPDEQELVPMDWDELQWLAWRGWEIGSHTCSHPHLPEEDDAVLAFELERSRETLEMHMSKRCDSLAYPYGDFNRRVIEAARAAGYGSACTLNAVDEPHALAWPRVGLYDVDRGARLRLKLSTRLRRLHASLRGGHPERVST
jgi:peptidoglycan/xylan/chitin deacetylase (PgdA/CDA1 family)